jgi:predicted dithiol-disulfide oxidoreductase (DUF899 family)
MSLPSRPGLVFRGRDEEAHMPEHTIGTREEWQAARAELAKLEAEQAEKNEEVKKKRLELPWVPVEKEYEFDTEEGKKSLADLFEGRSQLLAYNIMFGPDYENGACPGCTSLGDGLDGSLTLWGAQIRFRLQSAHCRCGPEFWYPTRLRLARNQTPATPK